MTSIYTAPVYKMQDFNNLFIELTAKNCNKRCQSCYIDFPASNKIVKDFISIDKIKEALLDTKQENLQCIYLTGAEPMMHPDFNTILRLCLKRCNVCICTNGSFLNEKKVRFLSKVESEGNNEILFSLSLTHFDEFENDKAKYRGHYRQTIFALKTLARYNFYSVVNIQNYYNLDTILIQKSFIKIFKDNGIENTDLKINLSYPSKENLDKDEVTKTDCMFGRCLGENGIYACPFLSNDFRGRLGSSFKNFSKNMSAETDFCTTCSLNKKQIFSIS